MKASFTTWVLVAVVVAASVLLLLSLIPEEPGEASRAGSATQSERPQAEVTLPDPPGPLLVRWKVPAGESLLYEVTSRRSERLGQTTRTTSAAGTLRLRGVGPDEMEAEFVLRQSQAEARVSAPGPGTEATVRETFSLDSRGRLRGGLRRARRFSRLFGLAFPLPEEPLSRGRTVSDRSEAPVGLGGVELLSRRDNWVRTVSSAGYPAVRLERLITRYTESPPRAGYRVVSDSTLQSVCLFAYREGFIVELTLEQVTTFTSTGRAGARTLAGTTEVTQQASLKLLSVGAEEARGAPGGDRLGVQ